MTIDYVALNTEIITDPLNMGYAQYVQRGDDTDVAALLNATIGNGAATLPNNPISGQAFLAAFDSGEFSQLTPIQLQQVQIYISAGTIAIGSPPTQAWIASLTAMAPKTAGKLAQLYNRVCSRAETLFGSGTIIQHLDIAQALRGVSMAQVI